MNARHLALAVVVVLTLVVWINAAPAAEPVDVPLGNLKVKFAPPAGWTKQEGMVGYADLAGNKGSFTIMGTPVQIPPETEAVMNKASYDAGQARVKTGELVSADWKELDGIKGVLTVESTKDPNIRRMQWIASARGHYLNITFASTSAAFDGYKAAFDAVLSSIKWGK